MPIQYKSRTYDDNSLHTSPTVVEPTSTARGDLLLAVYIVMNSASTLTIPSGWTSLASGLISGSQLKYSISYIVRGGSAPSYAFTNTTSGSAFSIHVLSYSGVNIESPIDKIVIGSDVLNTTNNNPTPPSITPILADEMVVAIGLHDLGAAGHGFNPPAGYTIWSENLNSYKVIVGSRLKLTATSETPGSFSNANAASANSKSFTLALRPSISQNAGLPVLVESFSSGYNSAAASQSFTVTLNTNDALVLAAHVSSATTTIGTPTGGTGITFFNNNSNNTGFFNNYIYWAAQIPAQTATITVSRTAGTDNWGYTCLHFSNVSTIPLNVFGPGGDVEWRAQPADGMVTTAFTGYISQLAFLCISDSTATSGSYGSRQYVSPHAPAVDVVYTNLDAGSAYFAYFPLVVDPSQINAPSVSYGLSAPTTMNATLKVSGMNGETPTVNPGIGWI